MRLRKLIIISFVGAILIKVEIPFGPLQVRGQELGFIVILLGALILFSRRSIKVKKSAIYVVIPFIIALIYSCIYLLFQPFSLSNSIIDIIEIIEIIISFTLLCALVKNLEDIAYIFNTIKFASLIESIVFFTVFLGYGEAYTDILGIGVPPNFPAIGLTGVAICVSFLMAVRRSSITDTIICLLLMLRGIFQFTRSIYIFTPLACLIPLFLIADIYKDNRSGYLTSVKYLFAFFIITFVSIFLTSFTPANVSVSFQSEIASIISGEGGLFKRGVVWFATIEAFLENPLGAGFGNSKAAMIEAYKNGLNFPGWLVGAAGQETVNSFLSESWLDRPSGHSSFFSMLIGIGILGPVVYIYLWGVIYSYIKRWYNEIGIMGREALSYGVYALGASVYLFLQSFINSLILNGDGVIVLSVTLPFVLYSQWRR